MGERDVVALERVDRDDGDSVSGGETHGQQARKPSLMRGVILTLAGGTLWGLNGTLSKVLMGTYSVDPLWLACARELTACWLFLAVAGTHSPSRLKGCLRSGRALLGVASVGICSILLSQVAYLEAIDWTNSATATVLQSLSVVIVMLFVCLVNRRLPRRRELVGVALAFAGTYLVATGGDLGALRLPPMGLAWGLTCAIAATILAIQPIRLIERWGNFTVNGLAFLISGVVLSAFVRPWAHMPALDAMGWTLVVLSIVFGTFGAYALYLQGVKEVGSMRGAMLGTSEPVMATVSSVVLLGAVFSPGDLLGFAMIIAMVFLTA